MAGRHVILSVDKVRTSACLILQKARLLSKWCVEPRHQRTKAQKIRSASAKQARSVYGTPSASRRTVRSLTDVCGQRTTGGAVNAKRRLAAAGLQDQYTLTLEPDLAFHRLRAFRYIAGERGRHPPTPLRVCLELRRSPSSKAPGSDSAESITLWIVGDE